MYFDVVVVVNRSPADVQTALRVQRTRHRWYLPRLSNDEGEWTVSTVSCLLNSSIHVSDDETAGEVIYKIPVCILLLS